MQIFRSLSRLGFWIAFAPFFISAAHAADLDSYHYVFVTGYKSEEIKGYVTENMRVMRDLGATEVDEIRPPSETAILENSKLIHARLLKLETSKPFVLIAHSKGGIETLQTLLRNAQDFTASRLARVILVQSPLQGSPYTDHVMDIWDHSIYAFTPAYWYFRSQHAGFLSMQTQNVRDDFRESLKLVTTAQLEDLSKRVFYLRSEKALADLRVSLKNSGEVLQSFGANDGLVPTTHMLFNGVAGFGKDLGVVSNLDHLDGFVAGSQHLEEFTKLLAKIAMSETPELTLKASPLVSSGR